MISFLERCKASPQGTIRFLYHDTGSDPMPADVSDPLALLGDIRLLQLSAAQMETLRSLVTEDLHREGAEEVWRTRAFRKNVIHSFGMVV